MTTGQLFLKHTFGGGWSTDFGPSANVSPNQNGEVRLPFLVNADNVIYELDGGPHKAPGTTKLNSSELESGAVIKGVTDYWKQGTAGSATQKRVIHINTVIKKDDADGSFSNIFTGLEAGKVPSYATFDDLLIIASDSTVDVPKSYDQSTVQDLAGSPPNFAFSETHKNRHWAAGNAAVPSRLYFSVNVDPEDWVGSGSGTIDIDPDDGDVITAIASHKDELWVFKGPYKGSIHRITGSAPTGTDTFARTTFINGLGAVGHNTLFRFGDDLGFMSPDGLIHSLNATAAFGDFHEATLSRPINSWIREHVNNSRLKHAWAQTFDEYGVVLLSLPIDSSTNNNIILMMDYRFLALDEPVRWAPWPAFEMGALGRVVDSNVPAIFAGGNDGFVRKMFQPNRSIDGATALSYKVTTPFLDYGSTITVKTMIGGSLSLQPKNNGNLTFGWQADANSQQTLTVAQGGVDVLGTASANQFTLGTSTLGGAMFVDKFFPTPTGGEFRQIQFEVTNNVVNEDVEMHAISALVERGASSMENN